MQTTRFVPTFNATGGYGPDVSASWWPLGDLPRKALGWLWPTRVPLGKVTLIVGDPGRGKSLLALDMAARVTRGAAWPDQAVASDECQVTSGECGVTSGEGRAAGEDCEVASEGGRVDDARPETRDASPEPLDASLATLYGVSEPRDWERETEEAPLEPRGAKLETPNPIGSVVLLSAEDDAMDTILPRLEAAGGDPKRVSILQSFRRRGKNGELPFSLSRDLSVLEAQVRERGDVRLVVLDPVSAYLGGVDTHSNADMREVLAPLRGVAERTGVAVVAISHLTKRADAAVLYRAMGSLAFVAAARAVWAVGPDRQTPGRLLFLPVKCNLAGGVTGLAYRIVGSAADPTVPVLAWEAGPVELSAEEALRVARAPSLTRRDAAGAWLAGLLSGGPVLCEEVERRAKEAGYSTVTLRRAKQELAVEAYHRGFATQWMWSLPGAHPEPAPDRALAPQAAEAPSSQAG